MMRTVTTNIEVRWGECDAAGIVYHPAYIDWFSVARMHYLKENGISYMSEFHDAGIVLVVLDVQCSYRKTLRSEDNVRVEASMKHLSKTRLTMIYRVVNEAGEVCASGHTEHAYVDNYNHRAVNLAKRATRLWTLLQTLSPKNAG